MIQRLHMIDDTGGRHASGMSAGLSAARPMGGDHLMCEFGVQRRMSGNRQISVKGKQVGNGYGQSGKSTPIGVRTGRAVSGDPGG